MSIQVRQWLSPWKRCPNPSRQRLLTACLSGVLVIHGCSLKNIDTSDGKGSPSKPSDRSDLDRPKRSHSDVCDRRICEIEARLLSVLESERCEMRRRDLTAEEIGGLWKAAGQKDVDETITAHNDAIQSEHFKTVLARLDTKYGFCHTRHLTLHAVASGQRELLLKATVVAYPGHPDTCRDAYDPDYGAAYSRHYTEQLGSSINFRDAFDRKLRVIFLGFISRTGDEEECSRGLGRPEEFYHGRPSPSDLLPDPTCSTQQLPRAPQPGCGKIDRPGAEFCTDKWQDIQGWIRKAGFREDEDRNLKLEEVQELWRLYGFPDTNPDIAKEYLSVFETPEFNTYKASIDSYYNERRSQSLMHLRLDAGAGSDPNFQALSSGYHWRTVNVVFEPDTNNISSIYYENHDLDSIPERCFRDAPPP